MKPGTPDLSANPFRVIVDKIIQPFLEQAFGASHRLSDLLSLFYEEHVEALSCGRAGGYRARGACADDDDIVFAFYPCSLPITFFNSYRSTILSFNEFITVKNTTEKL